MSNFGALFHPKIKSEINLFRSCGPFAGAGEGRKMVPTPKVFTLYRPFIGLEKGGEKDSL
jgi:hypothetical protein